MNSKKQLSAEQALTRCAALCSMGEQCPADLMEKMARWGVERDAARRVVEQLREQGFVDEERYARAFVNDKFRFNRWGRVKIARELSRRRIARDVVDDAMTRIDDDEYRTTLLSLLREKWRAVSGREPRAARAAVMRFALSRGFETSLIIACMNQLDLHPTADEIDGLAHDDMELD